MKLHIRDLSVLKKEAKSLKSKVKKIIPNQAQKSQFFLDTVAKMYGWNSWNALFCAHKKPIEQRLYSHRFLNDLRISELKRLSEQKESVLTDCLSVLQAPAEDVEHIVRQAVVEPFERSLTKNTPIGIDSIQMDKLPLDIWRRNMFVLGQSGRERDELLKAAVSHAMNMSGGVAFVGEKEAKSILQAAEELKTDLIRKGEDVLPLNIVMTDASYSPIATHHVAPFITGPDSLLGHYIEGILESFYIESDDSMMRGRALTFFNAFKVSATAMYGSVTEAINRGIDIASLSDIEGMVDLRGVNKSRGDLSTYLSKLPGHPSGSQLSPRRVVAEDLHGHITMQVASALRGDQTETDLPLLDLKKTLQEPSLTIFVVPDKPGGSPFLRLSGLVNVLLSQAEQSRAQFLKGEISQPPQKMLLYDNDKIPLHQNIPEKIWKSTGWASVVFRSPSTDWVKDNCFMSDYLDMVDVVTVLPTTNMESFVAAEAPEAIRERLGSGEILMWGAWDPDDLSATKLLKPN